MYNELGFGFLERIYKRALDLELTARGNRVAREVDVRVYYKREEVGWQRLDFVVDEALVIEVKSTRMLQLTPLVSSSTISKRRTFVPDYCFFGPKAKVSRVSRLRPE